MLSLPGTNGGRNGCILQGSSSCLSLIQRTDSLARGDAHSSPLSCLHQAHEAPPVGIGPHAVRSMYDSSSVQSRLLGPDDRVSHPRGAAVHGEGCLHIALRVRAPRPSWQSSCTLLIGLVHCRVWALDPSGQIRSHVSSPGFRHQASGASRMIRSLPNEGYSTEP